MSYVSRWHNIEPHEPETETPRSERPELFEQAVERQTDSDGGEQQRGLAQDGGDHPFVRPAVDGADEPDGSATPVRNPDPPGEPDTPEGRNPANESDDGEYLHTVQSGDTVQSIAEQYGQSKDDALLATPVLRDNPDGLPEYRDTPDGPEPFQVRILSDARLERVRGLAELTDGVSSLDDLSDGDRARVQEYVSLEIGEAAVGRGYDAQALEVGVNGRRDALSEMLPEVEGLDGLIDEAATDTLNALNGTEERIGLFSGLREPSDELGGLDPIEHGLETGDWAPFEEAAANVLRARLTRVDADEHEGTAARFMLELQQYGPLGNEGYSQALFGNDDGTGALHQVLVEDLAQEVRDAYGGGAGVADAYNGREDVGSAMLGAAALERVTRNVSPERADQILQELARPPEGSDAGSWDVATQGPHPDSALAGIVGVFGEEALYAGGTQPQQQSLDTIFGFLNTVATQASGARLVDDKGQPIAGTPPGLQALAQGMVNGLPNRDADENELSMPNSAGRFAMMVSDSIAEGDAAALPVAMIERFESSGRHSDAQALSGHVEEGVDELIENATEVADEYSTLLQGDLQHVASELDGWSSGEALQNALNDLSNEKRNEHQTLIEDFEHLLTAAMAMDGALSSLPPELREGLGDAPENLTHALEGDPGEDEPSSRPLLEVAFGDAMALPSDVSDLTLEQLGEMMRGSEGFAAFAEHYASVPDEHFDAAFGEVLETYEQLERKIADPEAETGLPPLPADMGALPGPIAEILGGLDGKSEQERLESLRENPVHGALLMEHLAMLDNSPMPDGSPRGPSGGFLAREVRNTLIEGGNWRTSGAWAVDGNGVASRARVGVFHAPGTAIPAAVANIAGNAWAVAEFGRLGPYADDGYRADNTAWAAVFTGLVASSGVQLGGASGQMLVGAKPWQFAQGGNFDRFSAAAMRGNLPGMTAASRFLNVATAGVAYWTMGVEISRGDWASVAAWTPVAAGATMTGYASLGLAGAGPVGAIGTGLWLTGAVAVSALGEHRARTYHEADMQSVLGDLGVSDERAEILAQGRPWAGGLFAPGEGTSAFPLLTQLAEYRGIDTDDPEAFQQFTHAILYDEEAVSNAKLTVILDQAEQVRWLDQAGRFLEDPDVKHEFPYSDQHAYYSIGDLSAFIDGLDVELPGRTPD